MSQIGAAPITAPGWTGKPKNGVAVVDCDVHHNFRNPEQLLPYLSTFYQEHLLDQGLHLGGYPNIPIRTNRTDLKGRLKSRDHLIKKNTGGDPRDFNFTLEFLQEEHLDPWNIDYGLLTGPRFFTDIRDCPIQIGLPHCAGRSTIGRSNIGSTATSVSSTPSLFHLQTPPKR